MLKKLLLTTAIGALMISPALSQSSPSTNPSSPSYAPPPASSSDTMKSDTMKSDTTKSDTMKKSDTTTSNTSASLSGATISSQQPDQLLASKVKGADVIGSDNKKIGDVSDMLFSKDGKIDAYILSVGGFLGVGAKEVALAPSSLQLTQDEKGNWQFKISMTKDQLAQAPNFERAKERTATTGSSSPAKTTGSAPKSTMDSGPAPVNTPAPATNPPARP